MTFRMKAVSCFNRDCEISLCPCYISQYFEENMEDAHKSVLFYPLAILVMQIFAK